MTELSVQGFSIQACIHSSAYGGVYRASNHKSGLTVVLKVAVKTKSSPEQLSQLRNEFQILTSFANTDDLPKAIELIEHNQYLALVYEDFAGIALDQLIKQNRLTEHNTVSLMLKAFKVLQLIHSQGVIHKDLKPSNILCCPNSGKLWIIDFGLSIRFNQKLDQFHQPTSVSGSLFYMSPEQTGRINRFVDYRTDFYSLGLTFYQALTKTLPNQGYDNNQDFLYALLTNEIPPPHEVNRQISEPLSNIVMHLLEKDPENRYQTISGVVHDLSCYAAGSPFELAKYDICDHFCVPSQLYGREQQLQRLQTCFDKVKNGGQQQVFVAGYSGVGKTALVHELYRSVGNVNGYLMEGKFDQLQRNEPLFGFSKACNDFFATVLIESADTLALWRDKLLTELGENVSVVTEHISNLAKLLGRQPSPPYLAGEEGFNRLIFSFQTLLNCIASNEHPLVLFIDDLQWVDDASLKLIETLIHNQGTPYFMFIGAYRDNEVNAGHPLQDLIERSNYAPNNDEQSNGETSKLEQLVLTNLKAQDLEQILREGFQNRLANATCLTELVFEKTGGNPFFAIEFVDMLLRKKLIVLGTDKTWQFELEQIKRQSIADNLVELMRSKILSFSAESADLLGMAALLGHEFSLTQLEQVSDLTAESVKDALLPALHAGLLIANQNSFRFAHDGIQEAALQNMEPALQQRLHHQVGHILLTQCDGDKQKINTDIFAICFHLNAGYTELTTAAALPELLQLNLEAALKAKLSAAYDTALDYALSAVGYFEEMAITVQAQYGYPVYREAAENAFLAGDSERGNQFIDLAQGYAQLTHQKFELSSLQVTNLVHQGEYVSSMDLGISALSLYNINLPPVSDNTIVDRYFAEQQQKFASNWLNRDKQISDLYDLPLNHSEEIHHLMTLLGELYASALMSYPNYLKAITITLVNICVERGNSPSSPVAYAWHGSSIAAVSDDYDGAFEFGQLAIKLNEQKIKNPTIACKVYNMVGNFITFFKRPIRQSLPQLRRAYELGLASGDRLYAGYSIINELRNSLSTGMNLNQWLRLDEEVTIKLEQLDAAVMVEVRESFRSHALRLTAQSKAADSLDNDLFNEHEYRNKYAEVPLFGTLLDSWKIQSDYLLGYYDSAKSLSYFDITSIDSFVLGCEMRFYAALTLLHHAGCGDTDEISLNHIEKYVSQIDVLADHCVDNFGHLSEILKGEQARLKGDDIRAAGHFNRAVELAKQTEYLQYQALAHELLARLFFDIKLAQSGNSHMQQAYELYGSWGCIAKQRQLERIYPNVNFSELAGNKLSQQSSGLISKSEITHRIDLKSVIDASLAMASEVNFEKLLNKLLNVALVSAGAQRCVLLLPEQNDWVVAMEQTGKQRQDSPLQMVSCKGKLPTSVLNFVAHSGEDVILDNAQQHKLFASDDYVLRHKSKSIICLPLVHQGLTHAIIYLENNLSSSLFSTEESSRLKLLSSQMAASIRNAQNYRGLEDSKQQLNEMNLFLEQKVNSRTEELAQTINQLKNSQQQLVEQEKLASLGRLVAGVAHEVNTPLGISLLGNSIVSSAIAELEQKYKSQSLSKTDLSGFIDKAKDASEQVASNLHRASELINNFKQMAIDSHSDPLTQIDLIEWLNSITSSLELMLQQSRIKLHITMPEQPLIVQTYPSKLTQIITSLISNVIAHAYPEHFAAKQKQVHLRLSGEAENYAISVADNGIGMNEELKAQVLDPFFTTSRDSGGMGLGMSIVHNLVTHSLKGRLIIDSELQKGTQITLVFNNVN